MATYTDNQLSRILITAPMSGHTVGDVIEVYWRVTIATGLGAFYVTRNGVEITSGSPLLNSQPPSIIEKPLSPDELPISDSYYDRVNYSYSTTTGTTPDYRLTFSPSQSYPYMEKKTGIIIIEIDPDPAVDIEIRDISLRIASISYPTGSGSQDGAVTVEALGTNSPFKYSKTDPRALPDLDDGYFNTDGVFDALGPGAHTFYAMGTGITNPTTDVTSITIYLDYQLSLMQHPSFGAIVEQTYYDIDEQKYKVELLQSGYGGTAATDKKTSTSPIMINARGEGKDIYESGIISHNGSLQLLAETFGEWLEIAQGHEKQYAIRHSKWNGASYDMRWIGYCTPSSYSDFISAGKYFTNISAVDRLPDLKGFQFVYGPNGSGYLIKGQISQLLMLDICLRKLGMGFGYRIAANIHASAHDTDLDPLSQTYIDASIYTSDDGQSVENCAKVVQDILAPYGAILFAWAGYWYIVRTKELENTSVSYWQYNVNLTYQSTGSWAPRIEYKRPEEDTKFRWINGAQARSMTEAFAKVYTSRTLSLKNQEGGLLKPISYKTQILDENGNFVGYEGYTIIGENLSVDQSVIRTGATPTGTTGEGRAPRDNSDRYTQYLERINSATKTDNPTLVVRTRSYENNSKYIESSGYITFNETDSFELLIKMKVTAFFVQRTRKFTDYPIYSRLKWSLRIDNQWIDIYGRYWDEEIINALYIDAYDSIEDFSETYPFAQTSGSPSVFQLRIYPVDMGDYDIEVDGGTSLSDSEIRTAMSALDTADYNTGRRIILKGIDQTTIDRHYFYELQDGSGDEGINYIRPTDYNGTTNNKTWRLVSSTGLPNGEANYSPRLSYEADIAALDSIYETYSTFEDININFKPGSKEVPTGPLFTNRTTQANNNLELVDELNQFDLDGAFNNADQIILNYLRDETGEPTADWQEVGGTITKSIQQHKQDYIARLVKSVRARLNGNFIVTDTDLTPLNVLYDPIDSGRLYLPVGVSSDTKSRKHSGELIEIGSGDEVSTSAFTSGFKQSAYR